MLQAEDRILNAFQEVRAGKRFADWVQSRLKNYAESRQWLTNLDRWNDEQLREGYLNYFENTGQSLNPIYRDRIVRNATRFREVIKRLLDEAVPVDERLDSVLGGTLHVDGMGKGMATDFLMTAHPDRYCLWNSKTEMGLTSLGLMPTFRRGASTGKNYLQVWEAVKNLSRAVGSSGFLETDVFLHFVGAPEPEGETALKKVGLASSVAEESVGQGAGTIVRVQEERYGHPRGRGSPPIGGLYSLAVTLLSDDEQKALLLQTLYPKASASIPELESALKAVGLTDTSAPEIYTQALESLRAKQILDDEGSLTITGWEVARRMWTSSEVRAATDAWGKELTSAAKSWRVLAEYVKSLSPALEPKFEVFPLLTSGQGRARTRELEVEQKRVFGFVETQLRLARLCGLVSAWGGVIQYCAVAVEYTLGEILITHGKVNQSDTVPPLGDLLAKFGQSFPDASQGLKRLVAAISDYRNTAVHPRDLHLRPGEHQARNVYDLTVKFMETLKWAGSTWFLRPPGS
jgi:hypothetical protein